MAIQPCGANLCGFVSWAKESSATLGREVLIDMKPNGHSWFGTAVNVVDGEQYSARMSLQGPASLKVEGCVVGGMICGGQIGRASGNHKSTRLPGERATGRPAGLHSVRPLCQSCISTTLARRGQRVKGVNLPSRLGWFGRRSLFGKYVITFVALVISILALSGATEMWFTYSDRKAELLRTQMEKADDAAQRVEQFIAEIERQINWATRANSMSPMQRRDRLCADPPAHAGCLANFRARRQRPGNLADGPRRALTPDPEKDFSKSPPSSTPTTSAAWFGPVMFTRHGPIDADRHGPRRASRPASPSPRSS